MGDARAETIEMVREWDRQRWLEQNPPESEPDDFLDRWLPAAAPHLDAGWNGYGVAPSVTIHLRHCMGMSGSDQARERALAAADWIMREATLRFEQGYHPNPLTDLRPAVAMVGTPFPPLAAPDQRGLPFNGTPAFPHAGAPAIPSPSHTKSGQPETTHDR